MEVKRVKLIYFSPTGTTQKILESIAKGIAVEDVEHINVTTLKGVQEKISPFSDELVIIGAPVYGGRLPADAIHRFRQLKGNKTLAIPIVVYGNRAFDDALLELKNIAMELGFVPLAAGAFIGEHSFSTQDLPTANGRPDSKDIQKAMEFGAKIKENVQKLQSPDSRGDLVIPGRFPYEGGPRSMVVSPVTNEEICTICGTCATVCPTGAISINGIVATKIEACIHCCACIKNCPTGARVWQDGAMKKIAVWLNETCRTRKEPEIFGIDM